MSLEFSEGAVTRARRELKLVLSPEQAQLVCDRLSDEIGGETPFPTLITSIYFDRPGLELAARAIATPNDCVKVRTKEYFPDRGARGVDRVVVEVKRERDGLTRKRRVWIPRSELAGVIGPRSPLVRRGRRMLPVVAVTYVRQVFQRSESWRVTVDRDVCFYPVGSATAFSSRRVGPKELGRPVHVEPRVVVEVKHSNGKLPYWLYELQGVRSRGFSKFAEGMSRLYPIEANARG